MALRPGDIRNFETLKAAFINDEVALVECTLKTTGEYRAVICAAVKTLEGGVNMTPFALLPWDDPFILLAPPEGVETMDDEGGPE
jgi:hypothetical protein